MTLSEILHDSYVAFQRKHHAALELWAAEQQRTIAETAEFHRRSLAQVARNMRVQLQAAHFALPAPGDPDFLRIVQAKRNRETRLMLDAVDALEAYESRMRLLVDQPYFTLKGQA
jgi:hypothetical protein